MPSTINISKAIVYWSYSTNARECKAQYFAVSAIPSTVGSTLVYIAYPDQRSEQITNLATNNYTFLVQAITDAGWAFPYSYSYSPMTLIGV